MKYLLLGFVMSWLVAWGLALLPRVTYAGFVTYQESYTNQFFGIGDRTGPPRDPTEGSFLDVEILMESRWIGVQEKQVFSDPQRIPPPMPGMHVSISSPWWAWSIRRPYIFSFPEYIKNRREKLADPRPDHYSDHALLRYGFPLMSHEVRATYTHSMQPWVKPDEFTVEGAFTLGIPPLTDKVWSRRDQRVPFAESLFLPFVPLWGGLACNTLFYALAFSLTVTTMRAHRQLYRIRGGRCAICGYDLRYDFSRGCSECGWRRGEIAEI